MSAVSRVTRRRSSRLLALAAGAVLLVVATALPASAHVTVSSPDASPGGFGKLVFRVPTESATASTTKLTVYLPADHPFAEVSAKPLTGWAVTQTQRRLGSPLHSEGFTLTEATSSVTWTAGPVAGVEPGEFEEFELSVGPFPKGSSSLEIPAAQTYSDGTVVRWDQATVAGRAEPEHPAPVVSVAPAEGGHDLGTWLGGAGLVVALIALAAALLRGRGRAGARTA